MVVQMVLEGAGYAYECINITQFIYEEALQMGSLGVGTSLSKKNINKAHDIHFGPYQYALEGLWSFAVGYGWMIANVWMAYLTYWLAMTIMWRLQKGQIIEGIRQQDNKNPRDYGINWSEECQNFIHWVRTEIQDPYYREQAFNKDNPCKKAYQTYHNHHSPDDYDEFMILVNHYLTSGGSSWWEDIQAMLTRITDPVGTEQVTSYKGNYIKTNREKPTTKQKRELVSDIWGTFNTLQKLAYRNQPGGHSYFGYSLLFKSIWDEDIAYTGKYVPPWYGFLQFGSEERTDNQEYNILENKMTYRVSKDSVIVNSLVFHKGTSSFDPVAMIDLQTGDVKYLKDIDELVQANYISGQKTVWYETLLDYPRKDEFSDINNIPVRWGTLYLKADTNFIECFAYNPLWSLLEIRFPETFTGGAKVTFSTYKPVKDITVQIIREYDGAIIWQETTSDDGTIRLAIAQECDLVTLRITAPDKTVHEYQHLKPEEAAQHQYFNINNMPGA